MNISTMLGRTRRVLAQFGCLAALCAVASAQNKMPQLPQTTESFGGLTISPLIYRVATIGGRTGVLEFNMTGAPKANVNVRIRMHSAIFEDGSYNAILEAKHPRDCSAWFGISKERNELVKPGKRPVLGIKYTVPTSANGVYWALMTFEPRQVGSDVAPNLMYQIPIIFTVGKPGVPDIHVGTPTVAGDDKSSGVIIRVRNISRAHAVVGASAEIRSALSGTLITKTTVMDRNILPGTSRDLLMQLNYHFKDGAYRVSGHVDLGVRRLPTVVGEFLVKGGKISMTTASKMLEATPVIVEPGGFELAMAAGGRSLKSVKIKNISNRPITIQLEGRNVEQSDTGSIGIGDRQIPDSLNVSIEPRELVINPGVSASARLTVSSARDATGDHWFGISVKEKDNDKAFSQQLMAVVTFKNTLRPKVELEDITSRFDRNGSPTTFNFVLHNSGNSNVAVFMTAKLVPDAGGDNYQIEPTVPNEGKLIPGARLPASATLPPNLAPGKYVLVVGMQYTDKAGIEKKIPITIKSPSSNQKQ